MDEQKLSGKSFVISKQEVWEAFRRVKANKGSAGVDGRSIEDFELDLENNLYRLWNRMSSGSYFPPPVRVVEIPKSHGDGVRVLGVPTVADRIAQTVVARRLEERVEKIFHPDSYGYRPGRSALDAVGVCKRRCWKENWVVDLDIQKFFDTVQRDLVIRAVEANTDLPWVVLYVRRWLMAPLQYTDGTLLERDRGTPQGSAVSPVLANMFLHYAFDAWMVRRFPSVLFERYVDDIVVHCVSQAQATVVLAAIEGRMEEVGLRLHPDKTRIVYCRDGNRRKKHDNTDFTFLGFTFRSRSAKAKNGTIFSSFSPGISKEALKRISGEVRKWRIHHWVGLGLADIARRINPIVRGWMQYYGTFYRSELYPLLKRINSYVMRWLRSKYKRLRPIKKAKAAWRRIVAQYPRGFSHWEWQSSSWWSG